MIQFMANIHDLISKAYYTTWVPRKHHGTLGKRLEWFRNNETKSAEEIEKLRWSLLSRLLRHAEEHVPYYRQLFQKLSIRAADISTAEQFARLPLLTKTDIQEQLDSLVAENYDRKTLIRAATGGSTGAPVPFFHDREYERQNNALILRNQLWTGWNYGEPIVKVWGAAFDIQPQEQVKEKLTNILKNEITLPAFEMTRESQREWLEQISRIQPSLIIGYTNLLAKLAEFNQQNRIIEDDLGVKAVVCSAETLFPWQRELLQQTFGGRVFNRYGTRELSTVAHECPAGKLHIREDWLYVEIVDDQGLPAPPGQMGQVVLTSLFNLGMPFIRYAIQDVSAFAPADEPCSCGRTFGALSQIEGRIGDLIALPKGGHLSGLFFPHLFKEYDIRNFQVIQPAIDRLEIYIVKGEYFGAEASERIRRTISQHAPGIQLAFHFVAEISPTASGKHRHTVSHVTEAGVLKQDRYTSLSKLTRR